MPMSSSTPSTCWILFIASKLVPSVRFKEKFKLCKSVNVACICLGGRKKQSLMNNESCSCDVAGRPACTTSTQQQQVSRSRPGNYTCGRLTTLGWQLLIAPTRKVGRSGRELRMVKRLILSLSLLNWREERMREDKTRPKNKQTNQQINKCSV